jgi:effector-binding domain-containing protein
MEVDSLHYGFNIFATGVPASNLIVMRKEVLKTDKFKVAVEMQGNLQQYIKITQTKQVYPVIAQFLSKGKDSTQVNVGLYIDKEVPSANGIVFTRMPKGGPLYAAPFRGKFSKRGMAYEALKQYFSDRSYQTAILPFETYLDNRLPDSDDDLINIQVNFSTYPNSQNH